MATQNDPEDPAQAPESPPPGRMRRLVNATTAGIRQSRQASVNFIRNREFRIIPAIFVVMGVAILLSLGTWQVMRLHEKNAELQQIRTGLVQDAADLRDALPLRASQWEKLAHHPVRLQGAWLPMHQFRLAPRTFEEQVGYHLIQPLRLKDNQIVLVNRGFVPDGVSLMPAEENENVQVFGVAIQPPAIKPRYAPENIPSRNEWVWFDLKAMGHEIGFGRVAPVVVYEDRVVDRDSYPIGGQVPMPFHNRHRQYAVTWYCLALALIGVWMTASTPTPRKPEDLHNPAGPDLSDPVARRGMYPEATD